MSSKLTGSLFAVSPIVRIFLLPMIVGAIDCPPAKNSLAETNKPTIEFPKEMIIGKGDDEKAEATVTLTIMLDNIEEKTELKVTFKGTSTSAHITIQMLATQLRGGGPRTPTQWRFTPDYMNNKLIIEGFTDPKTQKFHPVKSIKFDSPNIPKKFWPAVKMPPNL